MITAIDLKMSVVSPELLAELEEVRKKVDGKLRHDFFSKINAFIMEDGFAGLQDRICEDLVSKIQTGDQVLVVKHEVIPLGQVHNPYAGTVIELSLGILSSNPRIEETEEPPLHKLVLPTDKYVKRNDKHRPYGSERWEPQQGPIRIGLFDLVPGLGNNLKKKVDEYFCPVSSSKRSWSRFSGDKGLFIYKNEEIEPFFRKEERNVRIYVQGLDLLKCEVKDELRRDYKGAIFEAAVKVVNELERLLIKETMITGKIDTIYSASERGGMVENGAILLVDGEDDAFFASYGLREDLRDIRGRIAGCLREAVDFGLHEANLKLKGRPGITLDVSEYVKGLCERYSK